ncbi:MAG: hypothetical protein HZB43_07855 [candidate division Zixibacteria bacterium]|nr:hypothetical protein [candidate division Zixibacteria bacterium]
MKRQFIILGAVATVVTGLLLVGCGKQADQQAASKTEPQPAVQQAQTQTLPAQEAKTHPVDWCVVSGEKLGEMGPAIDYSYKGRSIKFCCKNCIKIFDKAPDRFMARLDSAAAGLIKAPAAEPEEGSGG